MKSGDVVFTASTKGAEAFHIINVRDDELVGRKNGQTGFAWASKDDVHSDRAAALIEAAKMARKQCNGHRRKASEESAKAEELEALAAKHLLDAINLAVSPPANG